MEQFAVATMQQNTATCVHTCGIAATCGSVENAIAMLAKHMLLGFTYCLFL